MSTNQKVSIKPLTCEAFKIYGSFANMLEPKGPKLGGGLVEFFRDMEILSLGQTGAAAFSITRIQKRENIINGVECHMNTGEGVLPLDGDVLVHVAPASRKEAVPLNQIEVFRVPKGTLLTLRPGVWHGAPFAENADVVNVLVVLPERTYANDVFFYSIPKDEEIRIAKP